MVCVCVRACVRACVCSTSVGRQADLFIPTLSDVGFKAQLVNESRQQCGQLWSLVRELLASPQC